MFDIKTIAAVAGGAIVLGTVGFFALPILGTVLGLGAVGPVAGGIFAGA